MPQAVQIGAGKIGRGFLGALMHEGGYEITFIDTDAALVNRLNARRSYPLRLLTENAAETFTVSGFQAVHAQDEAAVTDALRRADLISVSVGVPNLPAVAKTLALGINARAGAHFSPVDIFIGENQWHAASLLRGYLAPHIIHHARDYFQNHVGLVEAVIGRTVPAPSDAILAEDPLLLVAEAVKELPVARDRMRGPIPTTLPGLLLAPEIEAYEARKLYLHNMGHAALAYLGCRRGHEYIWQCTADDAITDICRQAFAETSQAIAGQYAFAPEELTAYTHGLLRRFANKALGDTVARVAADPVRKLRPSDRLIGAANLCVQQRIEPSALAAIIAAALCYDDPSDSSAVTLQRMRREESNAAVLESVCGVDSDSAFGQLVICSLESPALW